MRTPKPENKVFFVRFHKDLQEMIEEYAQEHDIKKATLTSRILEEYVASPFPLSPLACCCFIKRGRGYEKIIGKGMNITMKKISINEIRIRAESEKMKECDYRAAIIFSYLEKEKGH